MKNKSSNNKDITSTSPMSRRQFLRQSSLATIALSMSACTSATRQPNAGALPIIDTHQHLWGRQPGAVMPAWAAQIPLMNENFMHEDYAQATIGLNIAQAIYMEVAVAPQFKLQEAQFAIAQCQDSSNPTKAAVISGQLNIPDFSTYITEQAKHSCVVGVREVLHIPAHKPGHCLGDNFVKSVQLLGEKNLTFDICMRPKELGDAVTLAKRCPNTQFIIDHCGNADPKLYMSSEARGTTQTPEWAQHTKQGWEANMSQLASLPNVHCKLSGIIARSVEGNNKAEQLAPIINRCLDWFGPKRIVFGGDWPVCLFGGSFQDWTIALKEVIANRPIQEQRAILHDNAQSIYLA